VFPVRYGLDSYILFRRNSVFKTLINEALRHEDVWGSACLAQQFLNSALDGGEWSASPTCPFTSQEQPPVPIG
jgi:hypothetical protein